MLMRRYFSLLPGLILCGLIAFIAAYLSEFSLLQSHGLSALTIAIIAGAVNGSW